MMQMKMYVILSSTKMDHNKMFEGAKMKNEKTKTKTRESFI